MLQLLGKVLSAWHGRRMSVKQDLILSRKPLAGFLAIGLAWAVYFAQMPVIKANVGASDGQYGLAILLGAFGAFAAMWLAPTFQRIAGGHGMAMGILVLAIGMFWAGASHSLMALTVAMFLASVGTGVVDVLVNARVSEIEEDSGRQLMNLNHALYAFAYTGGAFATGVFRSLGVAPVPIFLGLAVVLIVLAYGVRDVAPKIHSSKVGQAEGLPVLLVVLTGLIVMVAFLAEATTEGWSALHLERTLGGSPAEGAMGPGVLGLMMGIGRIFGHGLSKAIRDTHLMLAATVMSASGITLAGFAISVPVALLGFGIAGLGISVVVPLAMGLIGRLVPGPARLVAISRVSVIGYGAFFFGPSLMGQVAEHFGLRTAFVLVAVLLTVVSVTLIPALARRSG